VYDDSDYAYGMLYKLLGERTPDQSISHHRMPTMPEHINFVDSAPYENWYLIDDDHGFTVGTVYLTKGREIGIFLFRSQRGKGYGQEAIELLQEKHPGRLLANVNPANKASRKLWESLGGKVIQMTFEVSP
jgi:RimJ/RimL family protein N-acetyltransferase